MELQQLVDEYLTKARDDIPALETFYATSKVMGHFQPQLEERLRLCQELAAIGSQVVLPMIRAISAKLATLGPNLYGEVFNVAYSQLVLRNAEEVVEAIGSSARPAVLASLVDPSPVVRSLAAPFLGLTGMPDKSDVSALERAFGRESDPLTRIALGGTLLRLHWLSSQSARHAAAREVAPWADAVVPGWKSVARREGMEEEAALGIIVIENLAVLVGSQARLLARA